MNQKQSQEIKRMSITEFRTKGYLQELNRNFLHPLGLALETITRSRAEAFFHHIKQAWKALFTDHQTELGEVWDCRDAMQGIFYEPDERDDYELLLMNCKKEFIGAELSARAPHRTQALNGEMVEPIPAIGDRIDKEVIDKAVSQVNRGLEEKQNGNTRT